MQIKRVPCGAIPFFLIATCNIYWVFWLYRVVNELHARRATEVRPGTAVGMLLVPIYNLIWMFQLGGILKEGVLRAYAAKRLTPPQDMVVVWGLGLAFPSVLLFSAIAPVLGMLASFLLVTSVLCSVQSWMNRLALADRTRTRESAPPRRSESQFLSLTCPDCQKVLWLHQEQARIGSDAECNACGRRFAISVSQDSTRGATRTRATARHATASDSARLSAPAMEACSIAYRELGEDSEGIPITARGLANLLRRGVLDPDSVEIQRAGRPWTRLSEDLRPKPDSVSMPRQANRSSSLAAVVLFFLVAGFLAYQFLVNREAGGETERSAASSAALQSEALHETASGAVDAEGSEHFYSRASTGQIAAQQLREQAIRLITLVLT